MAVERVDVATMAVAMVAVVAVAVVVTTMAVTAAATTSGRGDRGCSISGGGNSFDDCSGNDDRSDNSDGLQR